MFTRVVKFAIQAQQAEAFKEATRAHARRSAQEAGISRFEVLQDQAQPVAFYLLITFENEASRELHFQSEHYKAWHAAVSAWFASPPEGVTCDDALAG